MPQRLNAICLPSSLQYFRLDVATALVIFCRQSRSPSLPTWRGPRFDMCLLAPLKSHLSTKGHKDGCYNGKCMFCGTPARQWRHICVRGRLNSGGAAASVITAELFLQRYRFSSPLHATTHTMGYKRDIGEVGEFFTCNARCDICLACSK